jgi:ABC-type phosphate transport system substrate-binding protein
MAAMLRRTRHTTPRTLLLTACLLLTRLGALGTTQSAGDIAVVVNPAVSVDNLTLGELRRLLLGDHEFWTSSARVTLLIRAPVARERDLLLKNVCQMTEAQFRQHWIGKVFRAETPSAPKIVFSAEMAIDVASRSPGAITFVEVSQVSKGLKVVKIDGRLPGEKGYLLH